MKSNYIFLKSNTTRKGKEAAEGTKEDNDTATSKKLTRKLKQAKGTETIRWCQ